jgi:hypothetical protein
MMVVPAIDTLALPVRGGRIAPRGPWAQGLLGALEHTSPGLTGASAPVRSSGVADEAAWIRDISGIQCGPASLMAHINSMVAMLWDTSRVQFPGACNTDEFLFYRCNDTLFLITPIDVGRENFLVC